MKDLIHVLNRNIPCHLIIDDAGKITTIGPLVNRFFPDVRAGKHVREYFRYETLCGHTIEDIFIYSGCLNFRSLTDANYLTGFVWPIEGGAVLAVGFSTDASMTTDDEVKLEYFAKTPPSAVSFIRANLVKLITSDFRELAELEKSQRVRADALLRDIKLLTAVTCHDVLNYHAVICRSIALMDAEDASSEVLELASRAKEATQRASMLLQAAMHLSEHQRETKAEFSIDETILEIESVLRTILPDDVDLSLKLMSPNAQATAIRSGFVASLLNLIKNAAEAIGNSSGSVRVSTTVFQKPSLVVSISVADTGGGFTKNKLDKLHHINSQSLRHPGSSLGLESVNRFCEQSGWVFEISSSGPEGSTVVITAPITTFSR